MVGEGQNLCKRADHYHVALAALLGRIDIDPLNQRTNDLHRLGPGGLVVEERLKLADLAAVKLGEVWMNVNRHFTVTVLEASLESAFTCLEILQLIPHQSRLSIARSDVVETAFNAALDSLEFLHMPPLVAVPLLAETREFPPELGRESLDEVFAAEQDLLEAADVNGGVKTGHVAA